jgi:hypothetical protein
MTIVAIDTCRTGFEPRLGTGLAPRHGLRSVAAVQIWHRSKGRITDIIA